MRREGKSWKPTGQSAQWKNVRVEKLEQEGRQWEG